MRHILLCLLPPNAPDFPLLGPASLAGALRRAGCGVTILDANLALYRRHRRSHWRWRGAGWTSWQTPPAPWLQESATLAAAALEAGAYDGLALSLGNAGWPFVVPLLEAVRRVEPQLPVLLGGPAFFHPGDVLRGRDMFGVDICYGEGEQVIVDWAKGLDRARRRAPRIFSAPLASLDELPDPDFSLFPAGYARSGVLPMESSRGCVNRCGFCDDTRMWRRYRGKSAARLSRDMHGLAERCAHVSFVDSLLNPSAQRLRELASVLRQAHARYGLTWEGMLECRHTDARSAGVLAAAGCTDVFLGVESFDRDFLRMLGKEHVSAQAPGAIRALAAAGIRVAMGFIVAGPPLQSQRQRAEDLRRLLDLAPCLSFVSVNPLCIPEGTPLWQNSARLGLVLPPVAPWMFWHGGDAGDVPRRLAWCRHVREALNAAGVATEMAAMPQGMLARQLEALR